MGSLRRVWKGSLEGEGSQERDRGKASLALDAPQLSVVHRFAVSSALTMTEFQRLGTTRRIRGWSLVLMSDLKIVIANGEDRILEEKATTYMGNHAHAHSRTHTHTHQCANTDHETIPEAQTPKHTHTHTHTLLCAALKESGV